MTKAELESKPLADLHSLAAEAGVPRYRMLSRTELIEKLSDGGSASGSRGGGSRSGGGQSRSGGGQSRSGGGESRSRPEGRERPPRRSRRRSGSGGADRERSPGPDRGGRGRERAERKPADRGPRQRPPRPEPLPPDPDAPPPEPPPAAAPSPAGEEPKPKSRRRRRRFGRRGRDEVSIPDLLLPPAAGRQAILCAESREGCTALLRGVAADFAKASKGPDPVVLLIDPSPEELADWKREVPDAEIVAAGQARHASDALAQAAARAADGDDMILLVDSLTRLAGAYGDAEAAKEFFDAGRAQGAAGGGSLTVLAALERPAS
jgi:transcription termination factor Rho